jgi:hypothetical protein
MHIKFMAVKLSFCICVCVWGGVIRSIGVDGFNKIKVYKSKFCFLKSSKREHFFLYFSRVAVCNSSRWAGGHTNLLQTVQTIARSLYNKCSAFHFIFTSLNLTQPVPCHLGQTDSQALWNIEFRIISFHVLQLNGCRRKLCTLHDNSMCVQVTSVRVHRHNWTHKSVGSGLVVYTTLILQTLGTVNSVCSGFGRIYYDALPIAR